MRKCIAITIPLALLVVGELLIDLAMAAERRSPVRIGALTASWGPTTHIVGLRHGLLELGYRENEDFVLGVRFTQGDIAVMPAAARKLVQYGVDLIYAAGDEAARAAQEATTQLPIVFAGPVDALGLGLVESYARPGGNVTGVTDLSLELSAKRLEVFRNLIPGLKRVLFPYNANHAYSVAETKAFREAAKRLGLELIERAVRTEQEAEATLSQIRHGDVDGILEGPSVSLNRQGFTPEAAAKQSNPAMFSGAFFVERGGLAAYGPDQYETGRQAARLVDKILKGEKPANIPVEVNSKIQFIINLKTAKALGLTIPPEVLYQADRVIR